MSASTPRRILLVEDDDDTRQLLAVALAAQGYEVAEAADAEKGIKALRGGRRFDMVLSDYDLPGKTGAAMLREAHRDGLLQGAATLIVTAHPDPEGVGDVKLVRKPLDLEKFLLQVRGIFDSRPAPTRTSPRPVTVRCRCLGRGGGRRGGQRVRPRIDLRLYVSSGVLCLHEGAPHHGEAAGDSPRAHIRFEVFDLAVEPERAEEGPRRLHSDPGQAGAGAAGLDRRRPQRSRRGGRPHPHVRDRAERPEGGSRAATLSLPPAPEDGDERRGLDRLDEVRLESRLLRTSARSRGSAPGGEGDGRHARFLARPRADLADELHPVLVRQADVGHDEVGHLPIEPGQCFPAGRGSA